MKIQLVVVASAALLVQLASAVPHGVDHNHFHRRRAIVTAREIVTDVVTVTDYSAVVWVDQAGNIISTDLRTLPPDPATATSSSVALTTSAAIVPDTTSTSEPALSPVSTAAPVSPTIDTDNGTQPVQSPTTTSVTAPPLDTAINKDNAQQNNNNVASVPPGFGVAYDAWSGSASGSGCRSNLANDFAFLASSGFSIVRVYDGCFDQAVNAAAANKLKLMIGLTTFQNFDANLIDMIAKVKSTAAGWSVVDTVFVGNELVQKGVVSAKDVADKVSSARATLQSQGGYSGNVVTVDTWIAMRDNPVICSTSNYCAANAHAFFDGAVQPNGVGKFVRMAQQSVSASNGGKRTVITESGWPHAGASFKNAVPSIQNQKIAMANLVDEFRSTPSDLFLFMAFDSKYKTSEAEIERNFGIFDSDHYTGGVI